MAQMLWITNDGKSFWTAKEAIEYEEKFQNKHIDEIFKIKIKEVLGDIDDKLIEKMREECNIVWNICDEYMREISGF